MSQAKEINKFAIVIPAYNEQATIADVVKRALNECDKVIVVDDGSSDKTIEELTIRASFTIISILLLESIFKAV